MNVEVVRRYLGASDVDTAPAATTVQLFGDVSRAPTGLRARLLRPLVFRDALLALGACVRSELHVDDVELAERILDPVVTVTADACYIEALSLDASTYARASLYGDAFSDRAHLHPGTTNVEFTPRLVAGLERIRSGTPTSLDVLAGGIELEVAGQVTTETRVTLPDAWVEGFARVQEALARPQRALDLHPGDLVDVLAYLRGRRAQTSPRSLRVELVPGAPPAFVVEPWEERFELARSRHDAAAAETIRLWGRRRLLLLERVLPHTRRVHARLEGSGRASFWRCDLGDSEFLLATSGWSARDWPGRPGDGALDVLFDPRGARRVARPLLPE
ncbi:MAG: hypothetical protein R3F62_23080 [Planctomycetota bacterium]